jgi:hypothetical protein
MRAPAKVFNLIKEFWEANKDFEQPERWPAGYVIAAFGLSRLAVLVNEGGSNSSL